MTLRSSVRRGLLAALASLCACGMPDMTAVTVPAAANAPAAHATSEPTSSQPRGVVAPQTRLDPAAIAAKTATKAAVATLEVALPPAAARGSLLRRLPRSTLCAIRLPHVERLTTAYERTSLHALVQSPMGAEGRAKMDEAFATMQRELGASFPDFATLKEQLLSLEGELVFAVVDLDALALAKPAGQIEELPATFAILFDAGATAHVADSLLQRAFPRIEAKARENGNAALRFELQHESADGWIRRAQNEGVCIDVARDRSQFVLVAGPPSGARGSSTPLPVREIEDSFLATATVRATPDFAARGSVPVAEVFVHLEPVWSAVELLAPPDVRRVVETLGAASIRGLSGAAALGAHGIDETLLVHSKDGTDLLTRALTHRAIDPRLARFLPADATSASIATFDLATFFDGVVAALTPDAKREVDAALATAREHGIDVRADLLHNLGPTFAVIGEVDVVGLLAGTKAPAEALDFTFVAALRDAPRLRALVDRCLESSGDFARHVRTTRSGGCTVQTLDALPLPGPDGRPIGELEPAWHIGDDALVLSLSRASLERALAAASVDGARGPDVVRTTLERDGASAFTVGRTRRASGDLASFSLGRRTSQGLEFSVYDGPGTASTALLTTGASIASSIAIPALLKARVDRNERRVVETLRSIASAQAQCRDARLVDVDGDGRGEFGTLHELFGITPRRGGLPPLEPPLLALSMTPAQDGTFELASYVFRLDLPARGATSRRAASSLEGDADEREFSVYAWPKSPGSNGVRVFALDADGTVFASDNRAKDQSYAGHARMPEKDASKMRFAIDAVPGSRDRRGRDGGMWRVVR